MRRRKKGSPVVWNTVYGTISTVMPRRGEELTKFESKNHFLVFLQKREDGEQQDGVMQQHPSRGMAILTSTT